MLVTATGAASPTDGLGGLVGVAARAIDSLGEWGVGAFTLAETVVPPIPSEVILPLAGYLAKQGSLNLVLVFVTSTLGAYLGALLLYWLGAKLGLERSIRGLSKLPLVDREDFEHAAGWFRRHGRSSIFFGRLLPGVRSLISLPAGAASMPLGTFSLYTLAGSGLWNGALIGLGYLLGTQYRLIEQYSRFLNYAVYAALVVTVVLLVARRVKRAKARR
ncbi:MULTISPECIES: DedA family protein [unclassified Arthrobacter]|jgi:membrane protein DedA with SNARE-associated domain|uniref:DedA family protein n=1 Tax=unclassified Arthrobacter TaxID=235627 RepID=UPI0009A713A4|nr:MULTISPECIES: DedA family protein [unclassified Arthrobacter]MDF2051351.1 DedA family protein [Arthrobacter sp. Cr_A7]SLK11783.1 membrane protein DedA, SNARE-associated domain [Arthrobacter sp. P2b]